LVIYYFAAANIFIMSNCKETINKAARSAKANAIICQRGMRVRGGIRRVPNADGNYSRVSAAGSSRKIVAKLVANEGPLYAHVS